MKPTLIIAVIASLGAGFLIGKSQIPKPKIQIKEVEVIKEKKVEVIKEVPVIDKTGDEALAKAFTLFLAALGLEKVKVQEDEVKEIMKDPTDFIARNSLKEKLTPQKDERNEESRWGMPRQASGMSISKNESAYKKVRFSPIPAISEPTVFIAKSKVINDAKELQKINGSYSGQINFFDGKYKGQRHRLVLNVDYFASDDGKGTDGQSEILLYDESGKNYSHSRGTGGNRNILNGEDGSFIIKIVDNNFIHFVTKYGMKMANYYDDGKLVGIAKLSEN
ncbi:hypothetical protein M902_2223 [Bacteriovorax sp. BAL6_X]|uniref:hypothetical protein n=1 Tax=Bacteriovorax sp. BAL6_X TaxID=1201290 RepID=UPI000385A993|nr:hypothetical protein [Bacteriovorax sp. BAL6_X]EPZ51815.1 hypothetical protein M902_2223 [Bacteriovorax sp. BAL6_X]